MQGSHAGKSRTARKRREQAAVHSQRMRHGDSHAAFRLKQRRRALKGVAKYGNKRVELMNQARLAKLF